MAGSVRARLDSLRARLRGTNPLGHIGYWTAAAAILVMGWALYSATSGMREAAARVDDSLIYLENIAGVRANMGRAASAQRGWMLYRADRFRQERDEALAAARRDLDELAQLSGPGELRRAHVARLRELIGKRKAIMAENEALTGPYDSATPGIGRAQRMSASIHAVLEQMRGDELKALADSRNVQQLAYDRTVTVLIGAVIIVITVMIPGYVGFVREARGRQEVERRLDRLANTLPGALVQYRMWPNGRSRYEYLSQGAERLRGIDRAAALRDPEVVLRTILDEDRPGFLAALAHGATTMSRVEHDYRARGPDGSVRWIRTSAAPRPMRDGSVRWSAYWSDVTDLKDIERELREARDAAERATRAKSTFLATMSHEIRTPMNGVLGMLELLALTDLAPEQRTTLQVVRESGRSLQRIIDDILDFSKIEAGKLELKPETASIADIVDRVRNIFSGNASSKGLLLRRHVDPAISPALVVDPMRLQQILNNLVSNAIKFTSKGEVEIRAELVSRLEGEDLVRLTVIDSGVGIPAHEVQKLFEPFSQAPGSGSAAGTGLGLSISRRLAQMMGGVMVLESEPGRGTKVTLTMPMPVARGRPTAREVVAPVPALPAPARRQAPSPEQAAADGTLVLIVDDHPINRMVLYRQVNTLGYAAECAENGVEALELWKSGRFGAVLSDVNMPDMDGYQLAAEIRACERRGGHGHVPIIACTANALQGEAEKCLAAGMDDYVPKPVDLSRLAEKLTAWLPLDRVERQGAFPRERDMPAAPASPLDRNVLAQVAGDDPAAQREILSRFRRFNAEDVVHLTKAAESWDLPYLNQAAHRIKGASRTIGAVSLAAACDKVEQASRAGDLGAAREHLPALLDELERLDSHLSALDLPEPAEDGEPRRRVGGTA